jgi:hypothetical protein
VDTRGDAARGQAEAHPSLEDQKSKSAALARGAQQFRYPVPDGSSIGARHRQRSTAARLAGGVGCREQQGPQLAPTLVGALDPKCWLAFLDSFRHAFLESKWNADLEYRGTPVLP